MKRQLYLIFSLLCTGFYTASAQQPIVISLEDMPVVNVKYSVQTTTAADISFEETGAGYKWDFTSLAAGLPLVQTYQPMRNFNSGYRMFFGNPLPNLGMPVYKDEFGFGDMLPFSPEEIVSFYQTSSKRFAQMGFGLTISGFAVAFPYSSPDVLYPLPLSYGKTDSSFSSLLIPMEGMFYFYREQWRKVTADGYGTLKTPYGSWQALRVRHDLLQSDTIGLDAETGFRQDSVKTVEFHWLAKGMGVPVLTVSGAYDENGRFTASYISMLEKKEAVVGIEEQSVSQNFNVFPIPAQAQLNISLPETVLNATLNIVTVQGKTVQQQQVNGQHLSINVSNLASGVYIVQLVQQDKVLQKRIVISR